MENKINLTQYARGSWQYEICRDLERYGTITNPVSFLKGKAKSYSGKYQDSFTNLLSRIKAAGYTIDYIPGVRGGTWSAQYKLVIPVELQKVA